MNNTERRTFTKEFKLDVIQQSYQCENIRQLASELGIRPQLIYKWRADYQGNPQTSFPGKGVQALTPQQQEVSRLKQELADARMERDILKKAIGIFGKTNG